jgi:hypothetical protein
MTLTNQGAQATFKVTMTLAASVVVRTDTGARLLIRTDTHEVVSVDGKAGAGGWEANG